jgi:hypothetical protein
MDAEKKKTTKSTTEAEPYTPSTSKAKFATFDPHYLKQVNCPAAQRYRENFK